MKSGRHGIILKYRGKEGTVAYWCEQYGISESSLRRRLNKGETLAQAIKSIKETKKKQPLIISYKGIKKTVQEWSKETGLSPATIYHRIDNGWSSKEIIETPVDTHRILKSCEKTPLEEGQRFGHLTILRCEGTENVTFSNGRVYKHYLYRVKCECGRVFVTRKINITGGHTTSCGCYKHSDEYLKKMGNGHKTHGDSKSKLYQIWRLIRVSCNCPTHRFYKDFGGKGIKVCSEWNDYETFKTWALENNYEDGLLLDRIDLNYNFEPENCFWTTLKEKNKRKKNNVFITYNGETHCLSEWANILNINIDTLRSRIFLHNMPLEKALTNEQIDCGKYYTYDGKTLNIKQWAEETGIPVNRLIYRLSHGYTIEEAIKYTKTSFGNQLVFYQDKTQTVKEWANEFGISLYTMKNKLKDMVCTVDEAFSMFKKDGCMGGNTFSHD